MIDPDFYTTLLRAAADRIDAEGVPPTGVLICVLFNDQAIAVHEGECRVALLGGAEVLRQRISREMIDYSDDDDDEAIEAHAPTVPPDCDIN